MTSRRALVAILAALACVAPSFALAASMRLSPASRTVQVGDMIQMYAFVDTDSAAINNAEARIVYPSAKLDFVSASKTGSIFSLWIAEPALESVGALVFNGGVPTPGYTGDSGQLVSFIFRAKESGPAVVSLQNAAVRANDGQGTDVLRRTETATIIIGQRPAPAAAEEGAAPPDVPPEEVAPVTPRDRGISPTLSSRTHPDQSAWYPDPNPQIAWTLPPGTEAVQTLVSSRRGAQPTVLYDPPIESRSVENLPDGVWYFNIRARIAGSWGPVAAYALRIDATPPVIRDADVAYDAERGMLTMRADAADAGSGIAKYEISIDGSSSQLSGSDFTRGFVAIPYAIPGEHTALLLVSDRAGNSVGVSRAFTVPTISPPAIESIRGRVIAGERLTIGGVAVPGARNIVVYLSRDDGKQDQFLTEANEDGRFSVSPASLRRGDYVVQAEAISGGGIRSEKSEPLRFSVEDEIVLGTERFGLTLPQTLLSLLLLIVLSLLMSAYAIALFWRIMPEETRKHSRRILRLDRAEPPESRRERVQ